MSEERRPLHLAALASAAVRGLDPVGVAEVYDDGRGHVAALVVDSTERRWLVEQPVSAAESAAQDLAGPLLPLLDARLPVTVPRPEGSVVVKKIGRVTVTAWPGDHRIAFDDVPPGPGLAAGIGRLLASIHNLDPDLYDEAGVPTYDAESYRRRRLAELDRAAATGHVPTGLLTRWEEALELVPLWRFAATPVHGSFDGDALRVSFTGEDAADGRITTVTSWDHAHVGDPADDFAALYDEAHPETFDSILEAYAQARTDRPDRGLETRARLAAELEPVAALLRAHATGDSVVVDEIAGQLRILDAETADHPLIRRPAAAATPATNAPVAADPAEQHDAPWGGSVRHHHESDDEFTEHVAGSHAPEGAAAELDGDRTDEIEQGYRNDREDREDTDALELTQGIVTPGADGGAPDDTHRASSHRDAAGLDDGHGLGFARAGAGPRVDTLRHGDLDRELDDDLGDIEGRHVGSRGPDLGPGSGPADAGERPVDLETERGPELLDAVPEADPVDGSDVTPLVPVEDDHVPASRSRADDAEAHWNRATDDIGPVHHVATLTPGTHADRPGREDDVRGTADDAERVEDEWDGETTTELPDTVRGSGDAPARPAGSRSAGGSRGRRAPEDTVAIPHRHDG